MTQRQKRQPESPDSHEGGPLTLAPIPPRRIDLATLENVRQEMARVYRFVDQGKIETQEGTRRVYILSQIGKVIEAADLERRLGALEDALPAGQLS